MKKIILFKFFLILSIISVFSQTTNTLRVESGIRDRVEFYQNNKKLNIYEVMHIMETNDIAYKIMKSAQNSLGLAYFFGIIGGLLIGFPLGTALTEGNPNWKLAAVGGGLALISFSIKKSYKQKVRTAVNFYNTGLNTGMLQNKTKVNFYITSNGVAMALSF